MMHTLTYTSRRVGTVIDLADPEGIMCGQILELRTRAWEFELGYRSLRATRPAKTVKVTGLVYGIPALEKAEELFDADMYAYLNDAAKPGVITVDGWSQTCLVVGHEPDYVSPVLVRGDFTVALLDGVWHKRDDVQHFWSDALQPGLDLDYPHDYPHDYMPTTRNATVANDAASSMPFEMVIYGPVSQPAIIIGGNRYELHMDIPSGSYVTVNSVEGQRSIVMTAENGDITNVFDKGERGNGINGGSYIFQPLPAGEHQVQWNGFGFDLTVIQERSTPPWWN